MHSTLGGGATSRPWVRADAALDGGPGGRDRAAYQSDPQAQGSPSILRLMSLRPAAQDASRTSRRSREVPPTTELAVIYGDTAHAMRTLRVDGCQLPICGFAQSSWVATGGHVWAFPSHPVSCPVSTDAAAVEVGGALERIAQGGPFPGFLRLGRTPARILTALAFPTVASV
jgi:hypothetical protein